MGSQEVKAREYICDGCGSYQLVATDDPATGTTVNWVTINAGGDGGDFWICKDSCITKAFKARYDLERDRRD